MVNITNKTYVYIESMNSEVKSSDLTVESSINTFSFENIKKYILECSERASDVFTSRVTSPPLVHIASHMYNTFNNQDFNQEQLEGRSNSYIINSIVKGKITTFIQINQSFFILGEATLPPVRSSRE